MSLRGGKRIDYRKMLSGGNDDDTASNSERDIEQHEPIDSEKDHVEVSSVHEESSPDESEIEAIEKRLSDSRMLKKKLKKLELRRLTEELQKTSKRVDKLKGANKGSKKVNISTLRGMKDVSEQVDKLMDKKVGNFGIISKRGRPKKKYSRSTRKSSCSSSSSCSSESSTSSSCNDGSTSSSDQSSDEDRKKKKKRNSRRNKKKDKVKKVNRRSGKSKKLTSTVKYPQEWPHTHLSLHFVSKNKGYEDLSIEEFCAGYASILETVKSKKEFKFRLSHLKDLMYLATKYRWDCILNYHAAVLLEIERGNVKWDDSFQMLQSTTLAGGFLQSDESNSTASKKSTEGPIMFCRNFQRGLCQEAHDHWGEFYGEQRYLRHICAKCWLQTRKKSPHSEDSDTCPLKE